jgi:hypothetical protein
VASGTGLKPVYLDVSRGVFVAGRKDKTPTNDPFGKIYHLNILNLLVYPLELNPNASLATADPFTQIATAGLALAIYVYDSTGAITLASQSSFTADTAANTLAGSLTLNTAAMIAYATSLSTNNIIVEARLTGSGLEATIGTNRQTPYAQVLKQLTTSASSPVTPGETYPTTNEMNSRCLLRDNAAGVGMILTSASGLKRKLFYLDDDGELQGTPLT